MSASVRELLAEHPLPPADGAKDERGHVLLVAGSALCPGSAVLSATAALRAGAGRVQVVTAPANVTAIGVAVPETLVLGWDGRCMPPDAVTERAATADVVCVGPGLGNDAPEMAIALAREGALTGLVLLDAAALPALDVLCAEHRCVVIPNEREARELLDVDDDIAALARQIASRAGQPAAVRGDTTIIDDGSSGWSEPAVTGLGTPGSGDVFAGLAAAFLSRGMPAAPALAWAVAVHADAGRALASGRPNPGVLARELIDAIPAAIAQLPSTTGTG
jgi:hydroxyethylthiazole kinase-like uncharacterized protein yjeF